MNKIYLSFLSLMAFAGASIAQPTITAANFVPTIGSSQLYYVADSNSVVNTTVGANVTFDYSTLQGYGELSTIYFIDPSTTPQGTADYPNSTYADTTSGSPQNISYHQEFTDSLINNGYILDIGGFGPTTVTYNFDPEIIMKFPFNYTNTFNDTYSGEFTFMSPGVPSVPITTNGYGNDTVTADAWGTLLLPNSVTITNVIRVKQIEHAVTDIITFPIWTGLPDIPSQNIDVEIVSYYDPTNTKSPVLTFVNSSIAGTVSTDVLSQYPLLTVGVNENLLNKTELNIYPNPANNVSNIMLNLTESTIVKIDLMNQLGQNVSEIFNGEMNKGKNKIRMKTSDLDAGIYFINTTINGEKMSEKLIVK